jgi:hypothetical protein
MLYGASEYLWWGLDNEPTYTSGKDWEHATTNFWGPSSGAVILTKDPDGTVHTRARLVGSFLYARHTWIDYYNKYGNCVGGGTDETPLGPGLFEGTTIATFGRPYYYRHAQNWPPAISSDVKFFLGTLTRSGRSVVGVDQFALLSATCTVGDKTVVSVQPFSRLEDAGFATWRCPDLGRTPTQVQGTIRFGSSFLIRVRSSCRLGDPAISGAYFDASYGLYFELCPGGGRVLTSCRPRRIRNYWPPPLLTP